MPKYGICYMLKDAKLGRWYSAPQGQYTIEQLRRRVILSPDADRLLTVRGVSVHAKLRRTGEPVGIRPLEAE